MNPLHAPTPSDLSNCCGRPVELSEDGEVCVCCDCGGECVIRNSDPEPRDR